jgi:hypothetical protein
MRSRSDRRTIAVRGRRKVVVVERRPIAGPQMAVGGLEARSGYVDIHRRQKPASGLPIANEVAAALARNPIRFPAAWFHGGER